MQLPCSPCPSVDKKGLRCSPRPSVDKKRFSSWSFVALRGQKRFSSRPFADKKGVLRAPPRPSVDKKVLRCSPPPSVDKKGLRCPPRPSVDKKGLRCPPRPSVDKKGLRCPPRPSVDKKKVFFAPLRGQKRCSSCPFAGYCGVPIKMRLPWNLIPVPLDELAQMCDNIIILATQFQDVFPNEICHILVTGSPQ